MAIEMSVFVLPPEEAGGPVPPAQLAFVDGGGTLLFDAVTLGLALGVDVGDANHALERMRREPPANRVLNAKELTAIVGMLDGLVPRLSTCADERQRPVQPEAAPLLESGVCRLSFGRLIVTRSGRDLGQVIELAEWTRRALAWAIDHRGRVVVDFDDEAVRGADA